MSEHHDEETLHKVYQALSAAGVGGATALDVVNEMQNRGILFREHAPEPQYGHAGQHHGRGTPDCPRDLHHHHDERCSPPRTLADQIAAMAMPTYHDALLRPLAGRGFEDRGDRFVHPDGVALILSDVAMTVEYAAPWADPEYDRTAWFRLDYGTSFEVVVDLLAALLDKVRGDREAGHDEMAAQARHEDEGPF